MTWPPHEPDAETCDPRDNDDGGEDEADRKLKMLREDGWTYQQIRRGDWRL